MSLPEVINVPNLPHPIFAQSVQMQVDGAGKVFVAATTNGSPKGGVYVWRVEGNSVVEVLSPGSDATFVIGSLQIFADGFLYLIACTSAKQPRAWRVPTWTPLAGGTTPMQPPATTTNVDAEARRMAQAALDQAGAGNRAVTEAVNTARDARRMAESLQGSLAQIAQSASGAAQVANDALREAQSKTSEQAAADIAWAKAGDRIAVWWNTMVDYKTPQLLNLIHNRVGKALMNAKLVPSWHNNPDETLKM